MWAVMALVCLAGGTAGQVAAEPIVRIASYNIKFLNADDLPSQRRQNLRAVIDSLGADVIGLQEIKDRRALEAIFPPADWHIVIDDDSDDDQDLAAVVRKPLEVVTPADLDADDADFLFADADELFFPNRRDLLKVEVRVPETDDTFVVLVTHAKSRLGGRAATDFRREGAAAMIVQRLERDFDETDHVILGDWNDNCDDRSLNILETGDPDTLGGIEDEPGAFPVNLLEPLCAQDQVTLGRSPADIEEGRIVVVEPGARVFNDMHRGDDTHTGDQMFDMILASPGMVARYVEDSAAVFDLAAAIEGSSSAQASDHLPVFVDIDSLRRRIGSRDRVIRPHRNHEERYPHIS
jgi:endonuclease/exonuclease/phosphatase family metal-dependent hydrolase